MNKKLGHRMYHYESLLRRVKFLEALIIEGKQDQEVLRNYLGDEYYNKFLAIKDKIKDPGYKDIYQLIKKDPNEVKAYIDSIKSNRDLRKNDKDGANLIYQDDLWKVYRITTYPAARLYGSGTKWCITGRYGMDDDPGGPDFFRDYIEDEDLDGGYYFYIKNDGKTKYCLLRQTDGEIHSIWNAIDNDIDPDDILHEEPDFPGIRGLFVPPPIKDNYSGLFSRKLQPVLTAIKNGDDVNEECTDDSKPYYGYTPIEWSMKNNRFDRSDFDISDALLKAGAELTPNVFWKGLIDFRPASVLQMYLMHGLADAVGVYELLEYALKMGSIDHIKAILKLKPDLNKKLPSGLTPIQTEKANQHFPGGRSGVIKLLIKYGAKAR